MKRIAVIEKDKCNPIGCGGYLCIRVCPSNRAGRECIVKGPDGKAQINEEACADSCSICVKKCPFGAIHMVNLPDKLASKPIHRYGKDGFIIYSLPTPIFGKVVGMVGVNGIGKSTAIKILAGVLKPNLGEIDSKETDYDKLIAFFKGTESQKFFEDLKDNKIKVSYKPQQIDQIPKTVKGKVKDLLKKVDERNQLDKIVKELELENILDNNINEVSGGELQRVAIAATVLKKADLYIFDELTSYLDIKQRLKISRFIKEFVTEKTAIIVIEHDLIALDYMADLVHIMYGEKGAYGIVSGLKTAKAGINTYLEGYLREENVRFRPYKIKFEVRPPSSTKKYENLTQWSGIKKKLGKFHLEAEQGSIYRKEICGVLGENGIGKTTFVRILAHDLKPDAGEIDKKIKVSYKPQYLDSTSEELVANILQEAVKKHVADIIDPLEIRELLFKQLNQLSGGELQRVAIALALSKDCDLILLDEPSAYLDVEQRLSVSKVIKNICDKGGLTTVVVDHDLLFLDYLSDRLLVFEGIPAIKGSAKGPFTMEHGMNSLLKEVNITLRREEESGRPRINKEDSYKDREQKKTGHYYYS